MMRTFLLAALIYTVAPVAADFLGPRYPIPIDVTSNKSAVAAYWHKITSGLETLLKHDNGYTSRERELNNTSFSLGFFSARDGQMDLLEFHHTARGVANGTRGARKVDGNTIYRINSLTQLMTMYAGLLTIKSEDWDRPLLELMPELQNNQTYSAIRRKAHSKVDATNAVPWGHISLRAVVGYLSGIPRDAVGQGNRPFVGTEDLFGHPEDPWAPPFYATERGLPSIYLNDSRDPARPVYVDLVNTIRSKTNTPWGSYLLGLANRSPTFLPWASPAVSNNGYVILGEVIRKTTGSETETTLLKNVFHPLGMTNSTTFRVKDESEALIPAGENVYKDFSSNLHISSPAFGGYSTLRDLARLGVGILNHTLLSAEETRRWMKPLSHTDRVWVSLGAPWEIMRHVDTGSNIVTDVYCKAGNSLAYSSFFCLLPDYDVGFTVLSASTTKSRLRLTGMLADTILDNLVPGLLAQGAAEAKDRFAGTYTTKAMGSQVSLKISVNQTVGAPPGLILSNFTYNGTDLLANGLLPNRLVPTIADTKNGKFAFRLVRQEGFPLGAVGRFADWESLSWAEVGRRTYANADLDLFVFDVDKKGGATAVCPVAFRVHMERNHKA
ncbi:hypothetical protein DCS_01763 [Drechmeria coniospora]|uniref:Uncharacterized protein n=1 Tax=Drechmeria coniospora TaxID=98403 RepID=A0A151GU39_DRECN|nr:hypothetical protein DCS_01763 [Drechmeria coniospora]KYK60625.1 hypothetical protein DCS_01763 [Drechmeria coniospora]ODA80783.1 hypothetical protein RJ55_03742 [Drechmeria coniospora]